MALRDGATGPCATRPEPIRAIPGVVTAGKMAALRSALVLFSNTDQSHFFKAGSIAVSQPCCSSNVAENLQPNSIYTVEARKKKQ